MDVTPLRQASCVPKSSLKPWMPERPRASWLAQTSAPDAEAKTPTKNHRCMSGESRFTEEQPGSGGTKRLPIGPLWMLYTFIPEERTRSSRRQRSHLVVQLSLCSVVSYRKHRKEKLGSSVHQPVAQPYE